MGRSTTGHAYIGTSGWSYAGWKTQFYAGVPRKDWLRYCTTQFTGIEINATFYGSQRRSTFEHWGAVAPPDFKFCIKGNRFVTHNRKLKDPDGPIERERSRAGALGDKLAAVVWQLPPSFKLDLARLIDYARALDHWPEVRHVIEFRHPSWFVGEVESLMRDRRLAVCISDAAAWPMWETVTTDLAYLRLHGHNRTYASAYSDAELDHWAGKARHWLARGFDVHAYFDNDAEGAAPYDALRLLQRLRPAAVPRYRRPVKARAATSDKE